MTMSVSCSHICRTTEFMWKDLPLPDGPRQKKFALSVIFSRPSFPLMSIATGTPWRSVYQIFRGVSSLRTVRSLYIRQAAASPSVRNRS